MTKAVLFDFDGVIADTEHIWFKTIDSVLCEYGHRYTKECQKKMIGCNNPTVQLKNIYDIGENTEILKTKVREKYKSLVMENVVPMPGLLDILKRLKGVFIWLAVASCSPKEVANSIIDKLAIRKYFSVLLFGDDVTNGKPHPEIFLLAAEKLKVQPKECVVIEDSPNGVLAAKAAGMKCIALQSTYIPEKDIRNADIVVGSLNEITLEMMGTI